MPVLFWHNFITSYPRMHRPSGWDRCPSKAPFFLALHIGWKVMIGWLEGDDWLVGDEEWTEG
jgi:hypothetical protein